MKILPLILIALVIALPVLAESDSITSTNFAQGPVMKTVFYWTTGSSNRCALATPSVYLRGQVSRVTFSSTATNNYDVTLKDASGFDILAGLGAGITKNAMITVVPALPLVAAGFTNATPVVVNDQVTALITNAGNAQSGTITIYLKP